MIQFIVFSRARPLQLHGYLTSLYAQCSGDFTVSVLVKVDEPYRQVYEEVLEAFQPVGVVEEIDFASDLAALLAFPAEYTCFGCDDVVFVAPFKVDELPPSVLGMSLRLGVNVTRDMFGGVLPQPRFAQEWPEWDFRADGSVGDWAYPWEVLGTVYRTEFAKEMVSAILPGSPSQLEEHGSRIWKQHTDLRHMAAYPTSRLVVPTVNVVQHEFPNGIKGAAPLSPEFLLDCWNQGLRLDTERYAGTAPDSWRIPEFYLTRVA